MSRFENIAVVESYLNGLASKDLSSVPFAPDITFEGPLMPKLAGRETIVGFLTNILPFIKGIEIKQHLVDGNYVATVFDMETVNGLDHVVDLCLVVDGLLTEVARSITQAKTLGRPRCWRKPDRDDLEVEGTRG